MGVSVFSTAGFPSIFLEANPKIAAEIEMEIRTKAGLISKKIEGNPVVEKPDIDKKN